MNIILIRKVENQCPRCRGGRRFKVEKVKGYDTPVITNMPCEKHKESDDMFEKVVQGLRVHANFSDKFTVAITPPVLSGATATKHSFS